MMQFILTGLAGLVCGVVLMRLFQMRATSAPTGESVTPVDPLASPVGTQGETGVGLTTAKLSPQHLLIAAGILAVLAVAIMLFRPDGGGPVAVPGSATAATGQVLDDVDTMMLKLEERLKANPTDGEGFRMLGWSYTNTGKPEKAVDPYKRAMALLPKRADVHAGYGETLTGVAKGQVTPEAKTAFDTAIRLDPNEPRARFFQSLYKSQHGEEKAALDEWIVLANTGQQDAPWQADLRQRIDGLAKKLGVDVSARLKPVAPSVTSGSAIPGMASAPALDPATIQAANALPAGDRQNMVDDMVEGLARKLKANPGDSDGWVRLLRSRMVLKDGEQAALDLADARKALAADAKGLAAVNVAAQEFNVPGK